MVDRQQKRNSCWMIVIDFSKFFRRYIVFPLTTPFVILTGTSLLLTWLIVDAMQRRWGRRKLLLFVRRHEYPLLSFFTILLCFFWTCGDSLYFDNGMTDEEVRKFKNLHRYDLDTFILRTLFIFVVALPITVIPLSIGRKRRGWFAFFLFLINLPLVVQWCPSALVNWWKQGARSARNIWSSPHVRLHKVSRVWPVLTTHSLVMGI